MFISKTFNKDITKIAHQYIEDLINDYRHEAGRHDDDCRRGETIGRPQDQDGFYSCTCLIDDVMIPFLTYVQSREKEILKEKQESKL